MIGIAGPAQPFVRELWLERGDVEGWLNWFAAGAMLVTGGGWTNSVT